MRKYFRFSQDIEKTKRVLRKNIFPNAPSKTRNGSLVVFRSDSSKDTHGINITAVLPPGNEQFNDYSFTLY